MQYCLVSLRTILSNEQALRCWLPGTRIAGKVKGIGQRHASPDQAMKSSVQAQFTHRCFAANYRCRYTAEIPYQSSATSVALFGILPSVTLIGENLGLLAFHSLQEVRLVALDAE